MNNYLNHSAAGTHWKKKNAKYIRKEGNRYIYADGTSTSAPTQPQVQQHISVPKNLQSTQGVSRTVMKSTPKNYEANLAKSSAPKYNQGISKYATAADRHTDGEETKEVTAADRTSAKQKAAAKATSSPSTRSSSAARRQDEIDYTKHEDKTKGRQGVQSYDPSSNKYSGRGGGGGTVAGAGNRQGGKGVKPTSLKDMIKLQAAQTLNNKSGFNDNPDAQNNTEGLNGLINTRGFSPQTLNTGLDAVERMFKKKA